MMQVDVLPVECDNVSGCSKCPWNLLQGSQADVTQGAV